MGVVFDWIPERLDAYPQKDGFNDVVFNVFWRVNATDGDKSSTISGKQAVKLDAEGDFTPYENLTREQVLGWVKDAMGQGRVVEIENYLIKQIGNQTNPPVSTPALPWGV